jgi:hypothetical protein
VTTIIDVKGMQGNYATKSYTGCAVSFVRVMHLIIHQKKFGKQKTGTESCDNWILTKMTVMVLLDLDYGCTAKPVRKYGSFL